jgi:O-antigen ligase
MNKYLISLYPWWYRMLFISFFLPPRWQTFVVVVALLGMSIPVLSKFSFRNQKIWISLILLTSVYWIYLIWIPFTAIDHRQELFALLERKVSLFLIPLSLFIVSKSNEINPFKELIWFAYSCVIWLIVINSFLWMQLPHNELNHVHYRDAFDRIGGLHPTYAGLYIAFSCCILLFNKDKLLPWQRILLHGLLVLFLILLAPKIILLYVFILYLFYFLVIWQGCIKGKIIAMTSTVAIGIFAVIYSPFLHQRVEEVARFFKKENVDGVSNSMNYRQLIWDIDLTLLKQHWLFGLGPGRLTYELNMTFDHASSLLGFPVGHYNTHNEFLNYWLSFGLLGIILLCLFWFVHLWKAFSEKSVFYIAFVLLLVMTSMTENIFSRQQGVIFSALFLSLFYFTFRKQSSTLSLI